MRVAIIGAGSAGLASIKCCLDEGLEPVCFEKGKDLGGLWRYDTTDEEHTCTYKSCVMITSKEMSCYSDFPVPKDYPLYLPHASVLKYLNLYADNFNLRSHIRFNTKILKITQTRGQNMNDEWTVTYKKRLSRENENKPPTNAKADNDGEEETFTETFDAVMVCSGHHWKPNLPKLVGFDKFQGEIIHSGSYKDAKDLYGKNVLVVGIGESATAIASELSSAGGEIHLSTRRGSWITSRLQHYGSPTDQCLHRRFLFRLPRKLVDWTLGKLANIHFDHKDYGLLPKNSYLEQFPVISDYLPYKILSGSILVKPDVVQLTDKEAHFEDGSVAENLDVVVLGTGYSYNYPFLEDGCVEFKDNKPVLYKHMFPVKENPTLAFISSIQPVGCLFPVGEMQARLATRVFKGAARLSGVEDMKREMAEEMERKRTEWHDPQKRSDTVYYIAYCNDLAEIIGCRPRLNRLLLTDPYLAIRCYFGPCSPPQYRLTGPGAWDGARRAIMELPTRNVHQMKKKVTSKSDTFKFVFETILGLVFMFLLFFAFSKYCL